MDCWLRQRAPLPSRGREVIRTTQYEVGTGEAVGTWSGHGAIHNYGNATDLPSLATDPTGSSRHMIIDPAGSLTVLASGGNPGAFDLNPVACAFHASINGITAKVVAGTGAYAKATGTLRANGVVNGYLSRTATGACGQNAPSSAFETDSTGGRRAHQPPHLVDSCRRLREEGPSDGGSFLVRST